MLRDIIKEKRPNDFELTKEQENALINAFLSGNRIFDEDTPSFIIENSECINAAIDRDVNSANYIEYFTPALLERVRKMAINQKYILKPNSPKFLKNNYAIALNSIRQDANSANFVDWESMSKEDYDDLIEETIKAGYELSSTTNQCIELAENEKIVLNSIKRNPETIRYVSYQARQYPEVFKILLINDYDFSKRELERRPLAEFADKEIMGYVFKKMDLLNENDENIFEAFSDKPDEINKYIERFNTLFSKAIGTYPTINNFESIFQLCAELNWKGYKEININDYANVFGKICTELKSNNIFNVAIEELEFLDKMKSALDDKYNLLMQAMIEYHTIIHKNGNLDQINQARDTIAKLSALYISKSKEDYKKTIEKRQKEKFVELLQSLDDGTCEYINNLANKYSDSENIDITIIRSMVDHFLIGYSKLDSFIKAPRGFNNYKRYEEASKLINRLNSKYIKYTDQDVIKYMDIIMYDSETGKYRYQGPLFDAVEVSKYNEYRKKQRIFENIKKDIIIKAKTLEIDKNIDNNDIRISTNNEIFYLEIKCKKFNSPIIIEEKGSKSRK